MRDGERFAADLERHNALTRLAEAMAEAHPDDLKALCAAVLERGAGGPDPAPWGPIREDAEWWADCATPPELEAYAGAALRRIERGNFAERARKRLIVALWETMPEAWRRQFVQRVDPHGRFHRGAA